jgi:hypothetical protein
MAFVLYIENRYSFHRSQESGLTVAQSRNEDRIKIFAETVLPSATHTNKATSGSALHTITPAIVRNRTPF